MKKIFVFLGLLLSSLFCFFGLSSKNVSALSIESGLSGNYNISINYSYKNADGTGGNNAATARGTIVANTIDLSKIYDNLVNHLSSQSKTLYEILSLTINFVNPLYIDNFNYYIRFDTTSSYLYQGDESNVRITTQFGNSFYLIQYNNNTIAVNPTSNSVLSNSNITSITLYQPYENFSLPESSNPHFIRTINFQTDLTESTILNQLANLQSKYDSLLNDYNSLNDRYQIDLETKYNEGYNLGYSEGVNSSNSLGDLMISVADTPISIFKSIFDFEVLGFNLSGFVFSLVSLSIVIWLIKRFI